MLRQLSIIKFTVLIILALASNPVFSSGSQQPSGTTNDYSTNLHDQVIDVSDLHQKHIAQLSNEERDWYNKFQDGLMFFDGWKDISQNILVCLPQEKRGGTRELLEAMGIRIGTEWSKNNETRKINTDQLRSWGDRLKEAQKEGAERLQETVKIISTEVDAILQQE